MGGWDRVYLYLSPPGKIQCTRLSIHLCLHLHVCVLPIFEIWAKISIVAKIQEGVREKRFFLSPKKFNICHLCHRYQVGEGLRLNWKTKHIFWSPCVYPINIFLNFWIGNYNCDSANIWVCEHNCEYRVIMKFGITR